MENIAKDHDRATTALVIIDMISDWTFPDAEKLLPQAARIAPAIQRLKRRCHGANVPVIFANDNRGHWRSDFPAVVTLAQRAGGPAARIAELLAPASTSDYFVLKPKSCAFFGTPLATLLAHLGVRQLILSGVASDQCVVATAFTARMLDYEVRVPRDCVISQTAQRTAASLRQLEQALRIRTSASSSLRLDHTA